MRAVLAYIGSSLFWSFAVLAISLGGKSNVFLWTGTFFLFEGIAMSVFASMFGLSIFEVWGGLKRLGSYDRNARWLTSLLVLGQIQIPLFAGSVVLVGGVSAAAAYELWTIPLAVFLSFGGGSLAMGKWKFAAVSLIAGTGIALVAVGRGVTSGDGALSSSVGLALGVLSAVFAAGFTSATVHLSDWRRHVSSGANQDSRQSEIVASFLLVGFSGAAMSPVFFVLYLLGAGGNADVSHIVTSAGICAVMSVGSTYLLRAGALLSKSTASSLWLNSNVVMSMAWLVLFTDVELRHGHIFWGGAGLIVASSMLTQIKTSDYRAPKSFKRHMPSAKVQLIHSTATEAS